MSSVRFLYLLLNTWRRFFQLWRAWTTKEQSDLLEHQHRRYWGHHLPYGRRASCYENSFCAFFLFSKKRSPKGRRLLRKKRYSLCLLFGSKEIWFCHQVIYGTGALLHTMSHWRSGCHFLPFLKQSLPPVLSFAPFLCQVIMYLTAQPLGNREKKQIWTSNECHA